MQKAAGFLKEQINLGAHHLSSNEPNMSARYADAFLWNSLNSNFQDNPAALLLETYARNKHIPELFNFTRHTAKKLKGQFVLNDFGQQTNQLDLVLDSIPEQRWQDLINLYGGADILIGELIDFFGDGYTLELNFQLPSALSSSSLICLEEEQTFLFHSRFRGYMDWLSTGGFDQPSNNLNFVLSSRLDAKHISEFTTNKFTKALSSGALHKRFKPGFDGANMAYMSRAYGVSTRLDRKKNEMDMNYLLGHLDDAVLLAFVDKELFLDVFNFLVALPKNANWHEYYQYSLDPLIQMGNIINSAKELEGLYLYDYIRKVAPSFLQHFILERWWKTHKLQSLLEGKIDWQEYQRLN